MQPVESVIQISDFRHKIKAECGSVVSNYAVLPSEAEKWIDSHNLFWLDKEHSIFLIHKAARVYEVFFFAGDYVRMTNALAKVNMPDDKPVTLEILSKDKNFSLQREPLMVLTRMSSDEIPSYKSESAHIAVKCKVEDLAVIEQILLTNFNPTAERIPDLDELRKLIGPDNLGDIYLVKDNDRIIGLMIFSVGGGTIHLRYWWTDPAYRGQRIGSSLLKSFFNRGKDLKRMILWVDILNSNAISKYEHYGFRQEQMYDYIYEI